MYTLLYASEALPFNSSQLKSPPKHILFKMFKTGSSDIVSQCQEFFNFPDVSELLFRRKLLHMKQWRYTDPCISSDHRRLRSRQHKPYTGMSRSWSRHTSRSHHTAYFDIDQLFSHSDFLKRNADYITKLSLKDRHHSRITVHSAVTTLQNDASNFPSVSIIIYTMCLSQKVYFLMFDNNFGKCGPICKSLYQLIRRKIIYVCTTKIFTSPAVCRYTTL